jgi:hypothetical protein
MLPSSDVLNAISLRCFYLTQYEIQVVGSGDALLDVCEEDSYIHARVLRL